MLKAFCSRWWLVVPAPWKQILLALSELPDGWGLIEIGTGEPRVVVAAREREAEEPTPAFLRALLRAADAAAERFERDDAGLDEAPLRPISRELSKKRTALMCGHTVPTSLGKKPVPRLPCLGCAEGLPTDRAVVEDLVAYATKEELAAFAALIALRRAE